MPSEFNKYFIHGVTPRGSYEWNTTYNSINNIYAFKDYLVNGFGFVNLVSYNVISSTQMELVLSTKPTFVLNHILLIKNSGILDGEYRLDSYTNDTTIRVTSILPINATSGTFSSGQIGFAPLGWLIAYEDSTTVIFSTDPNKDTLPLYIKMTTTNADTYSGIRVTYGRSISGSTVNGTFVYSDYFLLQRPFTGYNYSIIGTSKGFYLILAGGCAYWAVSNRNTSTFLYIGEVKRISSIFNRGVMVNSSNSWNSSQLYGAVPFGLDSTSTNVYNKTVTSNFSTGYNNNVDLGSVGYIPNTQLYYASNTYNDGFNKKLLSNTPYIFNNGVCIAPSLQQMVCNYYHTATNYGLETEYFNNNGKYYFSIQFGNRAVAIDLSTPINIATPYLDTITMDNSY